MKPRTLIAIAVAGACACSSGAYAASAWNGHEVLTPSSINESAPWLANEDMPGSRTPLIAAMAIEEVAIADPMVVEEVAIAEPVVMEEVAITEPVVVEEVAIITPSDGGEVALIVPADVEEVAVIAPADAVELAFVEPDPATGASQDASGSGTVAFDSSMSESPDAEVVVYTPAAAKIMETFGEATPLLSEHYLVPAPLSALAGAEPIVLAIGPAPEDIALLDSLKQDFYVFTPAYDDA
jgi:hypothetical protein